MKQAEKTQITKDNIIKNAIIEFGTKPYESASINSICAAANISKGLVYYNFKNKDELYLTCLKIAFDTFVEFIKENTKISENPGVTMNNIFTVRKDFVLKYPKLSRIFLYSIMKPPVHIKDEIKEIRTPFDTLHKDIISETIKSIDLRDNVSPETATKYMMILLSMFNEYFQQKIDINAVNDDMFMLHDQKLQEFTDFIIYGLAKDKK